MHIHSIKFAAGLLQGSVPHSALALCEFCVKKPDKIEDMLHLREIFSFEQLIKVKKSFPLKKTHATRIFKKHLLHTDTSCDRLLLILQNGNWFRSELRSMLLETSPIHQSVGGC